MSYRDFDWVEFVEQLFQTPPDNPFTHRVTFLDTVDQKQLVQLLGTMLCLGAKNKFHKEIAHLSESEIDELQRYFHSIGFHVHYQIQTENRYVESLGKTVPVNQFQIDFAMYDGKFDAYNRPEKGE